MTFIALNATSITMLSIWTFIFVFAIIIESQTANLVSIWFAIAAIPSIIISAFPNIPFYVSIIVFTVLVVILLLSTRGISKKIIGKAKLATNVDQIIGETAIVVKKITELERGVVKVNNDSWTAVSNEECNVGEKVFIEQVVGNHVIVKHFKEVNI